MARPLQFAALCAMLIVADVGVALAGGWHAVAFLYHRFGECRYPSTSVTLEQFEAHLEYLEAEDYNVWPLERIIEHKQSGKTVPDRTVAITIDDAYLSVYKEAYPRLRERGFPFIVFVATDAIDNREGAIMDWQQMREMQDNGASFGNHSASHDHLVRRKGGESETDYRKRVRDDLKKARQRMAEELDADAIAPLFAYPYGEYNAVVAAIAGDLGYVSFGQHSGVIGPHGDDRALPRFAMAEAYADIDEFARKASAKALPVVRLEPWEPRLDANNPPRMRAELANSGARLEQLACFVSRHGQVDVQWDDREARIFSVRAPGPLPTGRSRYNCTAPSEEDGRFYWFSQQWLVLP